MVDIVIPVYRPDEKFDTLLKRILRQSVKPEKLILMLTVISDSPEAEILELKKHVDNIFSECGNQKIKSEVHAVLKSEFSHGLTRNKGISFCDSEYVLLMTQDALPADKKLIENLLNALKKNPDASQAYARQITDKSAPEYIKLTQAFNYPEKSIIKGKEDYAALGIKTIFCSDVCCMYRREVFEKLGGFLNVIFNEDMIFAGHAVNAGYKICYVSEARVIHYHKYTCRQQRKRNFDLAVSQKEHPEIFGGLASVGEGKKMVLQVMKKLICHGKVFQCIYYVVWSANKFLGYSLGKKYNLLPKGFVKKMSANSGYFK